MFRTSVNRKLGMAGAVFAGIVLVANVASAHVEITADGPPGSDDVVLSSVFAENECSGAQQTVELVFPATPELTTATPGETTGWTSAVTKRDGSEAVASILWTNTANATGDGEFQLALGKISTDQEPVEFKALQTCPDGKVFRWIETAEGAEFPAPTLVLDHTGHTGHHGSEPTTETKVAVTTASKDDSGSSTGVIVGIVAASLALIAAGVVLLRRKK